MIRIGTGGYNHRDWIGSFYPAGMGPARYLARFAEEFDVCEIRLASSRLPEAAEAERILGESGGRLLFTAFAPGWLVEAVRSERRVDLPAVGAGFLVGEGEFSEIPGRDFSRQLECAGHGPDPWHLRTRSLEAAGGRIEKVETPRTRTSRRRQPPVAARESADARGAFPPMARLLVRLREALLPYQRAGRFGGLVLPLPSDVPAREETLATIARFHEGLEGLPLLVEPRDASWTDARVLDFLQDAGIGFVLADGPCTGSTGSALTPKARPDERKVWSRAVGDPEGPSSGPDCHGPRPLHAQRPITFVPLTAETAYVRFRGREGRAARSAHGVERQQTLVERQRTVEEDDAGSENAAVEVRRHRLRDSFDGRAGRSRAREVGGSLAGTRGRGELQAARSSYFYSWEELVEWLPALRALAARARDLFIVFDNPGGGRALENARMLRRLIGAMRPEDSRAEAYPLSGGYLDPPQRGGHDPADADQDVGIQPTVLNNELEKRTRRERGPRALPGPTEGEAPG